MRTVYQKEFIIDLKTVYKASSEDKASFELDKLIAKWSQKYPLAVNPWKNHWTHVSTFFKYPEHIRKLIYTTTAGANPPRRMPWWVCTGSCVR
jgi:transposase-like protein